MKPRRPAQEALDTAIYNWACALLDVLEEEGKEVTLAPHSEGIIRISGAPITLKRARVVQIYGELPRLEREAVEENRRISAAIEALVPAGSSR